MRMIKKVSKILGGLLVAVLLAGTAFGAAVTINITGITNHTGSPLTVGRFVQVVRSTDGTADFGDTVVSTGTINPAGAFSSGASIPSGQYVYIRAWESWDGTGTPPSGAYYGTSAPENVGSGFVYTYDPAGFSTTAQYNALNITTTSLPSGTVGTPYSATVIATGGTTPYTWSISAGSLPGGLSLNTSSGVISGTPTATGTFSFTVQVADSGTQTDTQPLSITISSGGGALNITTTSLPGGTVGTPYSATVIATGGTIPYTWSISAGSLPAGLSLNASSGVISGTPTAAETANFTVRVQDSAAGSDTQVLSIVISSSGSSVSITSVTPSTAYVGQTIVIAGSGFGSTEGSSTVTIGGVAGNPTAWSATSITVAVPSGAATGNVVVTVGADTANSAITVAAGGVVIDDVEGGSVGTWPDPTTGLAQSGYYAFGTGVTPDNSSITTDGPQAAALKHGARGMRVQYSYLSGWGGGWGATLANTLDLSSYDTISFYVAWDGSSNDVKISLKDSDGTAFAATISNITLTSVSGYGKVTVNKTAFSHDADGSDPGSDATPNWAAVKNYSIGYPTTGTATGYQYIDSISAGNVDFGGTDEVEVSEVIIDSVTPPAGPAGTQVLISGEGFGAAQGQSILILENLDSHITYQLEVLSWSETSIEAIVPRLAPAGNYRMKVIKIAVTAGTMQAFESNPAGFRVTAIMSSAGIATIFPNPFNPLETSVPATRASGLPASAATIAYNATGITNIGIYIYDATARLVYHTVTNTNQVSWDGRDDQGNLVGDGVYLLRVVNEESKSTIAKGKILVIKR